MKADPAYVADLRQLLIQQFMLHEVQHHVIQGGRPAVAAARVPIAHGLLDIYKCLHQGEFGVGHTIDHPEGFKQRLHQEILREAAVDFPGEPAAEVVSADGCMLRINLRALAAHFREDLAGAADVLTRVCMESARVTRGEGARFFASLDLFEMLNRNGEIVLGGHVFAFPADMVKPFFLDVMQLARRIGQVPVFSHSETYRRLNRPSYRVVQRSTLQASPLARLLEQ